MNLFKKLSPFIVILVLSFFTFKPLLSPGFFPIHDDTQVARVYEMTKALGDGMFPVRWSQDLGYGFGYPIFNFYDPLSYYIGGFLGVLGADALWATKATMFLGIIFSSFFMYLLAREFWGKWGGVFASLLYSYAPYHAVDIYVRGDIAEFWAYAFIPLLFYGLWKIYQKQQWEYVVLASFAFASIIVSHNLTALMVFPYLIFASVLSVVYAKNNKKFITALYLFIGLLFGFMLSAFYSVPAILEMKYTNILSQVGGGADFKDHFVCLGQLWTSVWGYGGSTAGCNDGVSFMIGKPHIALSIFLFCVALGIIIFKKYLNYFGEERWKLYVILGAFIGFLVSISATLEISKPIWQLFPVMAFLQFPWRFLMMVVFFASFMSGGLIWGVNKFIKNKIISFILISFLIVGIVIVSSKFFVPQVVLNKTAADYTDINVIKWTTSRISDEYLPQHFQKPQSIEQAADFSSLNSDNIKISVISQKTQELKLSVVVRKDVRVALPFTYFPGWKGFLDGKNIVLEEAMAGTLVVDLPQGGHILRLSFSQTGIEMLGNALSLAGILILFLGIIRCKKKYE